MLQLEPTRLFSWAFTVAEELAVDQPLTLNASDGDGDAVFVTWEPGMDAGTYFRKTTSPPRVRSWRAASSARWR